MLKEKKSLGVNHTSVVSNSNKGPIKWCKGKSTSAHNPYWIKNNDWSADTWQLKCRSCGRTLGTKRIINGEDSISVKKFNGYENFLGGPK